MSQSILQIVSEKSFDSLREIMQMLFNETTKLENELPEGFTVFNVEPDSLNARRKLRTANMVDF